ncbi:MAG TPA: monovalent cation/H(+) antiporter subunit G [Thermoanaerobaculia bacterium]|nr:monovalent cation/H(+) antiporter subunit G [Thermoanaerobaculia bacterium]
MIGWLLDAASWLLLAFGSLFCLVGSLGVLRFPDFYTRCHAAGITDTFGAVLILAGLALQGGFSQGVTLKLALVCGFLLLSSPVASHALVKAAHAHGVLVPQPVPDRVSEYPKSETAGDHRSQER